ncbi:MAG: hypothetical protein AAF411_01325 [Myxococcota bacterium]
MKPRTRHAFGALLITLMAASSVRAQDSSEARAVAHYEAARAHVESGNYGDAHAEFARGFALSNRPLFLFNMAECSLLLGNGTIARDEYTRYLELDPNGSRATDARARLISLGAPVPDAREANSDDSEAADSGSTEVPESSATDPTVGHGTSNTDPATIEPAPRAERTRGLTWLGAALLAGSVVPFVLAGQRFAEAIDIEDQLVMQFGSLRVIPLDDREAQAQNEKRQREERIGIGLLVVGGVALGAGIAMIITDVRRANRAAEVGVTPTEGGAMAVGTFRF